MPESRGGHAIAVEQPVEEGCGANVVADDPRLIADPQQHQYDQGCRQITQRGQGPLLGNPGDAGHHQRKADGEPAFVERESQGERERGDSAVRRTRLPLSQDRRCGGRRTSSSVA